MSFSLDLEIIDALRSIARYTAGFLSEATITPNHFWNASPGGPGSYLPKYKIDSIGLHCFCGDGVIRFGNVRPDRIISLEVGPTITFNEQIDDIHISIDTPMLVQQKLKSIGCGRKNMSGRSSLTF